MARIEDPVGKARIPLLEDLLEEFQDMTDDLGSALRRMSLQMLLDDGLVEIVGVVTS